MEADYIHKLKDLVEEDSWLQRIYADLAFENMVLKDVVARVL